MMTIDFESLCEIVIVTTWCEAVAVSEDLCTSHVVALIFYGWIHILHDNPR